MFLSRNNIAAILNSEKATVMTKIPQTATLLLLLTFCYGSAWAQVTCNPAPGIPRTDTVTLNPPTISAGIDMPIGTIIYQGIWAGGTPGPQITCNTNSTTPESIYYNFGFILNSTPLPLSSWSVSPFAGAVYQTNIPGIGVALSRGDTSGAVTLETPLYSNSNSSITVNPSETTPHSVTNSTRYFSLVKTGTLIPGSYTLSAASLPSFRLFYTNGSNGLTNVIGFPLTTNIIQFQGQLNISTQTCVTPDVNVDMGTYEKLTSFTGQGSNTPWVDASIILSSCPTFYGYYDNNNSTLLFDNNTGGGSSIPASSNNNVGVRLTPSTSVIDSTNGIMAIDTSSPNSASGVGIQLGWGSPSSSPSLFDFTTEKLLQLPKDGSPIIRVPLSARYIQTAPIVTPGRADGKTVFLINYY